MGEGWARPAAVAGSEHPVPVQAVAECAGALLERDMEAPDALVVIASLSFAGALGDIAGALSQLLACDEVIALANEGVVVGGRTIVDGPALAVMAIRSPAVELTWAAPGEPACGGAAGGPRTQVLFCDPFSVSPEPVLPTRDGLVGGFLHGARGPGGNLMIVAGEEHREGSACLSLAPQSGATLLAHGCEAFAEPVVVAAARGRCITQLGDLPAAEAFESWVAAAADPTMAGATELGLRREEGGPLVAVRRTPDGLEAAAGFAVGELVEPVVRSARAAEAELRRLLDPPPVALLCLLDHRRAFPGHRGRAAGTANVATLAELTAGDHLGLAVGGIIRGQEGAPVAGQEWMALLAIRR